MQQLLITLAGGEEEERNWVSRSMWEVVLVDILASGAQALEHHPH
jgi:hypothetical protein